MKLNSQSIETSAIDLLLKQTITQEFNLGGSRGKTTGQWANIFRTEPTFDSAFDIISILKAFQEVNLVPRRGEPYKRG